jgi:hypothetical protein
MGVLEHWWDESRRVAPDERLIAVVSFDERPPEIVAAHDGRRQEVDLANLAQLSHHRIMEEAGAEAVELIMWLTMRGALSPKARRVHRHYYAPMTTGMGLITFEEQD